MDPDADCAVGSQCFRMEEKQEREYMLSWLSGSNLEIGQEGDMFSLFRVQSRSFRRSGETIWIWIRTME